MKHLRSFLHLLILFPILAVCILLTACPAAQTVDPPTNVAATQGDYDDKVVVTWNAVIGDPMVLSSTSADYYQVFRSNATWIGTDTFFKISGNVSGTTYTDFTAQKDAIYYYKIKSFLDNGTESEYSEVAEGFAGVYKPYNKWTQVELPGTVCGNGSQYKFYVNYSETSDNVIVYLEPGGACWDYLSCTGQTGIRGAANPNGIIDDYASGVPGIMSPLVFRAHPFDETPTQEWNIVFVPYCTGDVHIGSKVETYPDLTGQEDDLIWFHNGFNNTQSIIEWMKGEFPSIPKFLLSGSSAGGVGSVIQYHFFRSKLNIDKGYMLNDSGPAYIAPDDSYNSYPLHMTIKDVWNIYSIIDQAAVDYPDLADELLSLYDDFGNINEIISDEYPNDRLALTQFSMDLNFSSYSYERFFDPMNEDIIHQKWQEDQENIMGLYDGLDNMSYYIPWFRPFNESHCTVILAWAGTEITHSGTTVGDFINLLLDDSQPMQSYYETEAEDEPGDRLFLLGLADILLQTLM